jgi:adenosylhomocysteine nucleosidase
MPEEIRELRRRLHDCRGVPVGDRPAWVGHLRGVPVTLVLTGEGGENARRGAEALLGSGSERGLLVALGIAGAVDPRLSHADLVLGARILREGRPPLPMNDGLIANLERSLDAARGWIATVDRIVSSVEDKQALHRRWCSMPGPGLVDMESHPAVEVAERFGTPWVVLRAVSDTAFDALPDFLERCRGRDGAILRRDVVLHAMRNPRSVPDLVRLGSRTRRCARVLATALERLVVTVTESTSDSRCAYEGEG